MFNLKVYHHVQLPEEQILSALYQTTYEIFHWYTMSLINPCRLQTSRINTDYL